MARFTRSIPRAPGSTVAWTTIETFVTPLGSHDQVVPMRAHALGWELESKRKPSGRESAIDSATASRGIFVTSMVNATASPGAA